MFYRLFVLLTKSAECINMKVNNNYACKDFFIDADADEIEVAKNSKHSSFTSGKIL